MLGLFGKKDRIGEFWNWFARERERFQDLDPSNAHLIDELGKRVKAMDPDLVWEMGRADDGVHELILSADGIRDTIPKVEAAVQAAPTIEGWRVIAFRQPRADIDGLRLQYGPHELSVETVRFASRSDGEFVHLVLYLPGLDKESFQGLAGAAFLLMDASLGEYTVMTQVGEIDFEPIEAAPADAKPLRELRSVFAG